MFYEENFTLTIESHNDGEILINNSIKTITIKTSHLKRVMGFGFDFFLRLFLPGIPYLITTFNMIDGEFK